jgi:hypothetical protein
VLLAFLLTTSCVCPDLYSSGRGLSLRKYSSSAMPSSSYDALKASFRCTAEEATLERSWDRVEARFGGLPDNQDASESTEASDCDMTLTGAMPGLTGESDRAAAGECADSTRKSAGI